MPILSPVLPHNDTWRHPPLEFVPLSPFFSFCWLAQISKSAGLQRWLKRYHLCPICLLILRYRASILSLVSHAPYIIRLIRRGRFKPEPGDRNLVPRSAGGRRRLWFTCLLTPALDVSPRSQPPPLHPARGPGRSLFCWWLKPSWAIQIHRISIGHVCRCVGQASHYLAASINTAAVPDTACGSC